MTTVCLCLDLSLSINIYIYIHLTLILTLTLCRCKLAAYIIQEFPQIQEGVESCYIPLACVDGPDPDLSATGGEASPVLTYLMSIPPSAIDLEFQSIYTHHDVELSADRDMEGIVLLQSLLVSLTRSMTLGTHFEVLQAYVHRLLTIYTDIIIQIPELSQHLSQLKDAHYLFAEKFRHVVQSNLCILRILSKMPHI